MVYAMIKMRRNTSNWITNRNHRWVFSK